MEIDPSPTAAATRFTLPDRTSPTAKTPGRLVSSICGERASGQTGVSVAVPRSRPVRIKPLLSRERHPLSQSVLGEAPAIMNTWRISLAEVFPLALERHVFIM